MGDGVAVDTKPSMPSEVDGLGPGAVSGVGNGGTAVSLDPDGTGPAILLSVKGCGLKFLSNVNGTVPSAVDLAGLALPSDANDAALAELCGAGGAC